MKSTKPYLIRAFYEWIADNNCTPYIAVSTKNKKVKVPEEYIKNNQIILNISMQATKNLQLIENISFSATFSGEEQELFVPFSSVIAIYAKENGKGMVFNESEIDQEEDDNLPPNGGDDKSGKSSSGKGKSGSSKKSGSHLKVVK